MTTSPPNPVAAPPAPPGHGQAPQQSGLQSGLKNRHLSMIADRWGHRRRSVRRLRVRHRRRRSRHPALVRPGRRAGRPRDADARRDGRRQPDLRFLLRLRGPGARPLGRFLHRLAVLVLLGRGARRRGDRRCQDPHRLGPGRPAVGLGADRDDRPHRHQPRLGRLLRRVRVLVRRASRSSPSPPSSSSAAWRYSACCPAPTTRRPASAT